MTNFSKLLLLFCFSFNSYSLYLDFPGEKNNLQLASQKFEYSIREDNQISITEKIIDTSILNFKVSSSNKVNIFKFTWPSALYKDGYLQIQNGTGKVIWNYNLKKKKYTTITKENQTGELVELSELEVNNISNNLIQEIEFLPFFRFCVTGSSSEDRSVLCSSQLYLKKVNGKNELLERFKSENQETKVTINGKNSDLQGIILLNDASEKLYFSVQFKNGTFIDLTTQKINFPILDVFQNENNEIIIKTTKINFSQNSKVKKISPEIWEATLDKERPLLTIKTNSDIPLKQEFIIKNILPTKEDRINYDINSPKYTFSNEATIIVQSKNILLPGENSSINTNDSITKWNLENLNYGLNDRFIKTKKDPGFTAKYSIYKYNHRHLMLKLGMSLNAAHLSYGFEFENWFNHFLYINSSWSSMNWAVNLSSNNLGLNKSLDMKQTKIGLINKQSFQIFNYFNTLLSSFGITQNTFSTIPGTFTSSFISFKITSPEDLFYFNSSSLGIEYFPSLSLQHTNSSIINLSYSLLKEQNVNFKYGISFTSMNITNLTNNLLIESIFNYNF